MIQIQDFLLRKQIKKKISMVTCYDAWSARIIADSDIDCVLVGDSLSMVMHGHPTTLQATPELMALHTSAVARGLQGKFLVGDLPFLSYRKSLSKNVAAAGLLMQAGAHAVKLEGASGNLELIRHLVDSGIPVMGHLGLTPQSVFQLGGFKVQGKSDLQKAKIFEDALSLEKAGCFSLVLECVPSALAREISESLQIPTIGIGAGPSCDGQVLVLQDLLGMQKDFSPKFLRKYLDGYELIRSSLNEFHNDVVETSFPTEKESYL